MSVQRTETGIQGLTFVNRASGFCNSLRTVQLAMCCKIMAPVFLLLSSQLITVMEVIFSA